MGYRPEAFVSCSTSADLVLGNGSPGQDGIAETFLVYSMTRYSNGDAETRCQVTASTVESTAGGGYYPSVTPAAEQGGCLAILNMPPDADPLIGRWIFLLKSAGPSAAYSDDSSHPLNGTTIDFSGDECSVFKMNSAGEWQTTTYVDAGF